jgi:hypothetical protein
MLTFGSIINGAFRHFRERPLAVLMWGVIYTVITFGYSLAIKPAMAGQLTETQSGSQSVTALFGMMLPLYLIMLVISLALIAASLRTILRPGEDRLAGLRLGMDELRLLGLFALLGIALFIVSLIGIIVVGALGGLLAVAFGGMQSTIGVLLVFVPMLVFYCALIFLMVRLSLVSALTMLRRKIIIGESWRLTRGHFWRLFGAYFVLGVMLFALYIVLMLITVGPIFLQMFSHGFSPQGMQAASQMQLQRQLGGLSLTGIVSAVGQGLLVGLGYAFWGGAAATATQDLIGRTDVDLAETFA